MGGEKKTQTEKREEKRRSKRTPLTWNTNRRHHRKAQEIARNLCQRRQSPISQLLHHHGIRVYYNRGFNWSKFKQLIKVFPRISILKSGEGLIWNFLGIFDNFCLRSPLRLPQNRRGQVLRPTLRKGTLRLAPFVGGFTCHGLVRVTCAFNTHFLDLSLAFRSNSTP